MFGSYCHHWNAFILDSLPMVIRSKGVILQREPGAGSIGLPLQSLIRGAVILLTESRKSTKTVPENQKKCRKFGRKAENTNLESRKMEKKVCGKPENSYLCGGKPERDPLLPPLSLVIDCHMANWKFALGDRPRITVVSNTEEMMVKMVKRW